MKNILLLFLFFSIAICSIGQSKKKEIKLNKIKSVTVSQDDYKTGKVTSYKDSYEEYDKKGRLLINIEYRKDGTIKHKETNVYDAYGNKIEETLYDSKENKDKNEKKTYKYNAKNDKIEELEYDSSGKLVKKTTFDYDTNGNKTIELVYNSSDSLIKKIVYTYNNKKLKETKKTFNNSNNLESVKKYTYVFF